MSQSTLKVVVSGSFHRDYASILQAIREFESCGAQVLSPGKSSIVDASEQFVRLHSDPQDASPESLEMAHLRAIATSDLVYVCNPRGTIGVSVAFEVGWARALRKPVYAMEAPSDPTLGLIMPKSSPAMALDAVGLAGTSVAILDRMPLHELQRYVAQMVADRGFENEQTQDVLLLLVEEVGELAKAVRKRMGLKAGSHSSIHDVGSELSDILLYVLDLANVCQIDLGTALLAKEQVNRTRKWT